MDEEEDQLTKLAQERGISRSDLVEELALLGFKRQLTQAKHGATRTAERAERGRLMAEAMRGGPALLGATGKRTARTVDVLESQPPVLTAVGRVLVRDGEKFIIVRARLLKVEDTSQL